MFDTSPFYWLLAAFLLYMGWRNLRERQLLHTGFWWTLATLFAGGGHVLEASAAGNRLPAQIAGAGVIVLAAFALGMKRLTLAETPANIRTAFAQRLGHKLFIPALLIPLLTVVGVLIGPHLSIGGEPLIAHGSVTLISLSLASLLAAAAALLITRLPATSAVTEGRRLLDTIGWAALLPMVLATLGGVFAASNVDDAIAQLVSMMIPVDSRLACVLAYGLGMVVFTIIMGNAFAAFPVMTAGIGLPLLIQTHGADPAVVGAIGMLTGYCGTLMTPMAANFNLVPAALLELDDPNGVIRAQIPTAIPLLLVNLVFMAWLAFL